MMDKGSTVHLYIYFLTFPDINVNFPGKDTVSNPSHPKALDTVWLTLNDKIQM